MLRPVDQWAGDYRAKNASRKSEAVVDSADKKTGKNVAGIETPTTSGVKQDTQEKGRVKNQAEIDRVNRINKKREAENQRVEVRRQEIKAAVDGALDMLSKKLSSGKLSEREKEKLLWIKKNVKETSAKIKNSDYRVEAKDGDKVLDSRWEGLAIEDLQSEVDKEVESIKKVVKNTERVQQLKAKADANTLDEESKKREWKGVLDQLPEGNLKRRIFARVEEWKKADGREYSPAEMDQQLGEACFEIVKEHTQEKLDLLKQLGGEQTREAERLAKIFHTLQGASDKYFTYHYQKLSEDLTGAEKQKQELYTRREVGIIEKDPVYKKNLLENYGHKLPSNFDSWDLKKQNLKLAELALGNRLVLLMPRTKKLLEVPKVKYEDEQPVVIRDGTKEPGSRIEPVDPKHRLQNKNEPYDIENEAFGPGRLPPEPPETPAIPETPKKLLLVDISEIAKRMAWTKAEERLRKEFEPSGGFFKKLAKNAWKGLSEDTKRVRYYQQALNEIQADGNLMRAISERTSGQPLPNGGTQVSPEHDQLLKKIIGEYEHDVVDSQREVGDIVKDNGEVRAALAQLMYSHANNSWSKLGGEYTRLTGEKAVEYFVKDKILPLLHGQKWSKDLDQQKERKGLLYANNFLGIAESYKAYIQEQTKAAVKEFGERHEQQVLEHLQGTMNLDLQLGYKERDLVNNRPKGILNVYEKVVSWGEKHPVLGKIAMNPFVIGAAATLAGRGIQRATKWGMVAGGVALGAAGFWAPIGIGAVVGGAYRAFKRSKDIKHDQAQELRHQTLGGGPSEVLGKNNEMGYGTAIMSFKDAQSRVDALKDKTEFTDAEKSQLAQIYARLQLERGFMHDKNNQFTKVDLFKLEEDAGKRFGTTEVAKADLRIALKKLGISEQDLQGIIDVQKGTILDIIKAADKKQDSFRRKEMLKAGAFGAVAGLAGGVAAQAAINWGGEHVEKLWGGSYFKNHGTTLGQIRDWAKGSEVYKNYFGSSAPTVGVPKSMEALEYLNSLRGNVVGGNVETIHTVNWYDNQNPLESSHKHSLNELRFFISKDSSDNFHFKVPVQEGDSWHTTPDYKVAEINNAFSEGRIKMIFMPGGASPHEGVVLDVDPVTKEVVIPKGSNLRDLFDSNGRPKGNGVFGLAEQTGIRPDGSKNYVWINSDHGNNEKVVSQVVEQVKQNIEQGPKPIDYWSAIPTVPPTRKGWLRPENRAAIAERQRNAQTARHGGRIERATTTGGQEQAGRNEVGSTEQSMENNEQKLRIENPNYFDRAKVNKLVNTFQLDLDKDERVESGVNLKVIKSFWDEEAKAISKAKEKEAAEKKTAAEAAKHQTGHDKGQSGHEHAPAPVVKKELVIVHEVGPSLEEYMEEVKKLQEAIREAEGKFNRVAEIDKLIRQIETAGDADIVDEDIDDLHEEFKELTGSDWNKKFNPANYRKNQREKRRPFLKEPEEKKPPENKGSKGKGGAQPEEDSSEGAESDDNLTIEKGKKKETAREDLEKALKAFKAKFKNVDLEIGRNWQGNLELKTKAVKDFQALFTELIKDASFKPGKIKIILITGDKPSIRNGVWVLPSKVTAEQIKEALQGGRKDRGLKKKQRKQAA